jgi:hypothetical protein
MLLTTFDILRKVEDIKGIITKNTKNRYELKYSRRVIVPVPPHAILLQIYYIVDCCSSYPKTIVL